MVPSGKISLGGGVAGLGMSCGWLIPKKDLIGNSRIF